MRKRRGQRARIFRFVFFATVAVALFLGLGIFLLRKVFTVVEYYRFVNRDRIMRCRVLRPALDNVDYLTGVFIETRGDSKHIEHLYVIKVKRKAKLLAETLKTDGVVFELPNKYWLKTYGGPSDIVEIGSLYRVAEHVSNSPDCWVIRQVSYATGLFFNFAIVKNDGELAASNLSKGAVRDVSRLVKVVDATIVEPLLENKQVLEDGNEVFFIDYKTFRQRVKDSFFIPSVADEQAFLEIYNATDINGYAALWSRYFSTVGIEVSRIGTVDKNSVLTPDLKDKKAVIFVVSDKFPVTFKYVKNMLGPSNVAVVEGRPKRLLTTADIVIILLDSID